MKFFYKIKLLFHVQIHLYNFVQTNILVYNLLQMITEYEPKIVHGYIGGIYTINTLY